MLYILYCINYSIVLYSYYVIFSSHIKHNIFSIHAKSQGLFCDGTRRYGVPAPFFSSKEKTLFVMYYYYHRISDFRLVSTGTYYLVPAPISLQKSPAKSYYILYLYNIEGHE